MLLQQKSGDDGECCELSPSPKKVKPSPPMHEEISLAGLGITPISMHARLDKTPVSSIDRKLNLRSTEKYSDRYPQNIDSTFRVSTSIASEEFRNVHHPGSLLEMLNQQGISPKLFPKEPFTFKSYISDNRINISNISAFTSELSQFERTQREKINPKHPKPEFSQAQMPECRSVSTHITGGDSSNFYGDDSLNMSSNVHLISQNIPDHTHSNHNFFLSNRNTSGQQTLNFYCEESLDNMLSMSGRPTDTNVDTKGPNLSIFSTKTQDRARKEMTLEEQLAEFDAKCCRIEIESDLYLECVKIENDYTYDPYYFQSKQTDINSNMRTILLDWMMEVCTEFQLKRDTMYLSLAYVDLYLGQSPECQKSELQLVGVTSLFIASKIEVTNNFAVIVSNIFLLIGNFPS